MRGPKGRGERGQRNRAQALLGLQLTLLTARLRDVCSAQRLATCAVFAAFWELEILSRGVGRRYLRFIRTRSIGGPAGSLPRARRLAKHIGFGSL